MDWTNPSAGVLSTSGSDTTATLVTYLNANPTLGRVSLGGDTIAMLGYAYKINVVGSLTLEKIALGDVSFDLAANQTLTIGKETSGVATNGGSLFLSGATSNSAFGIGTATAVKLFDVNIKSNSAVRSDFGNFAGNTVFTLNGVTIEKIGAGTCNFYAKNAVIRGSPCRLINLTNALQNPTGISIQTDLEIRGAGQGVACSSGNGLLLKDINFIACTVDSATKWHTTFVRGNVDRTKIQFSRNPLDRQSEPCLLYTSDAADD
jgi:hypothetical protein